MASQKQIEANRRNAQRSTGPVTDLGKGVAKFNALKHGMTASTAVLPYEDPSSYAELRESFVATYKPANAVEASLVETVANSYWRLLRARRVETATMTWASEASRHDNNVEHSTHARTTTWPWPSFLNGQRRHPSSNRAPPGPDRAVLLPGHRNSAQSAKGTAPRRAPHHRAAQRKLASFRKTEAKSRSRTTKQRAGPSVSRHAALAGRQKSHQSEITGRQSPSPTTTAKCVK